MSPLVLPMLVLGKPLTAADVLRESQKAYDRVSTFEQSVTANLGNMKGTAHIWFSRPGRLRVMGDTMMNSKYDLVCDGKSTWVLSAGTWSKVESPDLGIASITGISANAGTLVPATLLHSKWGSLGMQSKGNPTLSAETVRGKRLLRVRAKSPFDSSIWIDPATYFVVRTEMTVMDRTITVTFTPPKVNNSIPLSRFKR